MRAAPSSLATQAAARFGWCSSSTATTARQRLPTSPSSVQLQIEGAAVEEVNRITSDDHYFELERCCGGWGVPRWPASGQAGPLAHAEFSRGMAGQRRGMLEAFLAARGGTA